MSKSKNLTTALIVILSLNLSACSRDGEGLEGASQAVSQALKGGTEKQIDAQDGLVEQRQIKRQEDAVRSNTAIPVAPEVAPHIDPAATVVPAPRRPDVSRVRQ